VYVTVIVGGVDSSSDGLCSSLKHKKVVILSGGGVPGHRTMVGTSSEGDDSWIVNVGITNPDFLSSLQDASSLLFSGGDKFTEICVPEDELKLRSDLCNKIM